MEASVLLRSFSVAPVSSCGQIASAHPYLKWAVGIRPATETLHIRSTDTVTNLGASAMPLLDRLRQELDRAGKSAQRALDEGRLRLDLYRARQSVDRFAQRFGYAVYRAKKAGVELTVEELAAHMGNMTAAEAEVTRLETLIAEASKQRRDLLTGNPPKPTAD
jgi:hypothetical protein